MSNQAKFSIVIFLVLLALLSCFYLLNTAHAPGAVNTTTTIPATGPKHSETTQSISSQSNNSGTAVGGK